jgi:hypothetical protein
LPLPLPGGATYPSVYFGGGRSRWKLAIVWHYNERMTGARNDAVTLVERLKSYDIDYDALLKTDVESAYSGGQNYDRQELTTFAWVLGLSPFLVLLVRLASFLR